MWPQGLAQMAEVLALPFLACAAMTGILGYLGLHVLKREIVFVDIALAQIVAVGAIAAHLLAGAPKDSVTAHASALGLAVLSAAFYAVTRRRVLEISVEAVIGVSYAIAAAAALFLLGVAADGHAHAQHMLAGSILWATRNDVLICSLAFVAAGACFYLLRRPFARISDDYAGAIRDGMPVVWWDFVFYTLLGVVITFAVRIGGVVVVFCLLIIPATIAVLLSRKERTRLLIAWAAGLTGSVLGLLFAERLDFSVGPSVALLLGIGLLVAGLWHRLGVALSAAVTVIVAAVYVGLLVFAPVAADSLRGSSSVARFTDADPVSGRQSGAPPSVGESDSDTADPGLEETGATAAFAPESLDPQARCDLVLETIKNDASSGAELALEFLEQDPPLFFRQRVVSLLEETLHETFGFDVTRPFADPVNQHAVGRLRAVLDLED